MKRVSLLLAASLVTLSPSYASDKSDIIDGEIKSLYNTVDLQAFTADFCESGQEINEVNAAAHIKKKLLGVYKTLNPDPTWFEYMWRSVGPASLSLGASLLGPLLAFRITNNQMIQAQLFSVFNSAVQVVIQSIASQEKKSASSLENIFFGIRPQERKISSPFENIFLAIKEINLEISFMVGVCKGGIGQESVKWLAQDLRLMRVLGQPPLKEFRDNLNIFLSVPTTKTEARQLSSLTGKEVRSATDHLNFHKASTLTVRDMVRYILADQKYTQDPMRPIFALVGPGGVGKTWFAEKILPKLTGLPVCTVDKNVFSSEAGLFGAPRTHNKHGDVAGSPGAVLECMIRTGSLNFILLLNEADLMIRSDQESFQRALNFFDSGKNTFYSPYLERELPYESIPVVLTSNSADFTGEQVSEISRDAFATRISGVLQVDYPQREQVSAYLLKLARAHEASLKLSDSALQNIVDTLSKRYCGEWAVALSECNYRSLTRLLKQRLILAAEFSDETCEEKACEGK